MLGEASSLAEVPVLPFSQERLSRLARSECRLGGSGVETGHGLGRADDTSENEHGSQADYSGGAYPAGDGELVSRPLSPVPAPSLARRLAAADLRLVAPPPLVFPGRRLLVGARDPERRLLRRGLCRPA
jgi:hypothetical protein